MDQEKTSHNPTSNHWLDKIPWGIAPVAIILALLPFKPMPHLAEKIGMLLNGSLVRPIDIFDLFMHGTPITLFALKSVRHLMVRSKS